MTKLMRSFLFVALLLGLSTPVFAVLQIDVSTDKTKYGYLWQNDPSVMPAAIRNFACVPVATANSLVYLENMYPGLYNRGLVPDNNPANGLIETAEIGGVASTLAGGNYMNTKVETGGTWQDMGIYGKYKYIEDNVPGVTSYAAQMSGTWAWPGGRPDDEIPDIEKPSWVQDNMSPTWMFLVNNLADKEDIEICINEGDWGHCLTLTSFHWLDMDDDTSIDQGEATIDFIDPATGMWVPAKSIYQAGGTLIVNYDLNHPAAQLEMAMKESPEPSTLTLFGIAAISLLGYTWRRRNR